MGASEWDGNEIDQYIVHLILFYDSLKCVFFTNF